MNFTVLIVDDAVENIQVLKSALETEFNLKVATNGKTAIKIANSFHPDIILLDIMMPDMDGYEVAENLQRNPYTSNIPIIFVTAMGAETDEVKGFNVGAVDYITKPISPVIVKARIKNHLALRYKKASIEFEVQDKTRELRQNRLDLIKRLALAAEYKEHDTAKHMQRVSNYSALIAEGLGFSPSEIEIISLAVQLHDVGKIGIDDAILNKPARYTDEEYEIMKKHTLIGEEILGDTDDRFMFAASVICAQHHERYDGTGYPHAIAGDKIHPYARICSVSDVFDALTSRRPYKEPWTFEDGFNYIIEQKGKQFDPAIVDSFEKQKMQLELVYKTMQ